MFRFFQCLCALRLKLKNSLAENTIFNCRIAKILIKEICYDYSADADGQLMAGVNQEFTIVPEKNGFMKKALGQLLVHTTSH